MKIVTVNYMGRVLDDVSNLPFRPCQPNMYVHKTDQYKIIIFPSKKCHIWGCRESIKTLSNLPFNIVINRIMSMTITLDIGKAIDLVKLGRTHSSYYEPEIFTGLRLLEFKPLCVNVFRSGKIVITGLRHVDKKLIKKVKEITNQMCVSIV